MDLELLPEQPGVYRLGRHRLHDPRSRDYDAVTLLGEYGLAVLPTTEVMHVQHEPPWNQGRIGSCTANAALGCLVSGPNWRGHAVDEGDATRLYMRETRLDDHQIPGEWPPDDTGSTGLWSMQALRQQGLITGYRHCFSVNTVLAVLAHYPVSIGIPWYQSMFAPGTDAVIEVDYGSPVAGGHQVALVGLDPARKLVRVRNSWGTGWGDGGYAWLRWSDLQTLLHLGGDAVVPVVAP
jgi:hypothetical protein